RWCRPPCGEDRGMMRTHAREPGSASRRSAVVFVAKALDEDACSAEGRHRVVFETCDVWTGELSNGASQEWREPGRHENQSWLSGRIDRPVPKDALHSGQVACHPIHMADSTEEQAV